MNRSLRTSISCASIWAAVGTFALVCADCPAARAADAGKEIATAAQHAGYAAESTAIGMAHAHLQHTINCLVGPKGDGSTWHAPTPVMPPRPTIGTPIRGR